ncbi:MAG: ABC transporter ATP-binding protein [Bacteroidales bacterium]
MLNRSTATRPPGKPSLFSLLKNYKLLIFFLVLFALLGNSTNLVIPKMISHGIDAFVAGSFDYTGIIVKFVTAIIAIFIFTYAQSIFQTLASEKVAKNLRTELAHKISNQSLSFIQKANPSKLLTNLTSDMDSVKMFVSMAVVNIVSSVFMIIAIFILLLIINWELALTVILIVPIILITFYMVLSKARPLFRKSREIIDRLNKVINESILGAAIIRVLNSQQPEYEKFLSANEVARDLGLSILRLFAILIPIIMLVANLAVVTILALGGHFVVISKMSIGDFAAFYSYLGMLIFPILMIGFMSNIMAQASASYNRIYEVLMASDSIKEGKSEMEITGRVELKNVCLSFDDKPVLKDISFVVEKGSRVAILGPTAAGKSQLLNLITNLIPPDSGSIEIDGTDINEFDKDFFHSNVGLVFQDSVMFNLSLRENIAFSDRVTGDSLKKAIETSELNDFIDSLPNNLDSMVSERGTSLSGGQKQRIMLARALAIQPKILLLDDFTARVDRKTEQKILSNIEKNYPELTLISVTQKISSVKKFDKIVVLMEGELIATGNHGELLETCPEYVQIYNSQLSTQHYEL